MFSPSSTPDDGQSRQPGRLRTGIDRLDEMLGGGLIPGKLTVVLGATGIGKTQLGVHFAHYGKLQDAAPGSGTAVAATAPGPEAGASADATETAPSGIFFDLTSRGDSQNHCDYAQRLFGWNLTERSADEDIAPTSVWDRAVSRCDYLHIFERSGRRVSVADLEPDEWRRWKIELGQKLDRTIAFFYGNFIHGVRRCVIDGVEPTDSASDSFQFHVFDYVYHQILRKDSDWLARDLFRAQFRAHEEAVNAHAYDQRSIGCLLLCTSREVFLDDLLSRPVDTGDVLTNANTIILMGKVREGGRMGRALHIAKHRGSACDDAIVPYNVTDRGLVL